MERAEANAKEKDETIGGRWWNVPRCIRVSFVGVKRCNDRKLLWGVQFFKYLYYGRRSFTAKTGLGLVAADSR